MIMGVDEYGFIPAECDICGVIHRFFAYESLGRRGWDVFNGYCVCKDCQRDGITARIIAGAEYGGESDGQD